MTHEDVNQLIGKTADTYVELTDAQLEEKIAAVAASYEAWRQSSDRRRAKVIGRVSAILHDPLDEFTRLSVEMEKRIDEARREVEQLLSRLK